MRFVLVMLLVLLMNNSALIAQEYQLGKPIIHVKGGEFFKKKALVIFDFRLAETALRFTTDGSEPTTTSSLYKKSIPIKNSSILKVKAFKNGFLPSETVTTKLIQLGERVEKAMIRPEASKAYPGNGAATLIDQQAGSLNFRDGNWLGYNQGPIIITLDLGEIKTVNEVIVSALTSAGSWIMPPTSIVIRGSFDGAHFMIDKEMNIPLLQQNDPSGKAYYNLALSGVKYRYIELLINPLSNLPDWHPGKGNAAWVFLDEIIIH